LKAAVDDTVCAVMLEPIQGEGGIVVPHPDYLKGVKEICREKGILLLVDGAQSVPHMPVNVAHLGCDFFAFSGHKMLGPTGTGVLWMKKAVLEPVQYGGGMVETVTGTDFTTAEGYQKYEAGTPAVAGGIGLGLWLVKSIVEAHGGRISVANRPIGGAIFSIYLPLEKQPEIPLESEGTNGE
jgi:cysteine desulfurase/selenocysteine lyase